MLSIGLNPYGIAYCNGLWGVGTPRANPRPLGLQSYMQLARTLGLRGIEFDVRMLAGIDERQLLGVRDTLRQWGFFTVLSQCPPLDQMPQSVQLAGALGARVIRLHLTPILCGDRAAPNCGWKDLLGRARRELTDAARIAGDSGIDLAVENHQDFTSGELVELCETCGSNVGVTLDTGNPLSVGEDPVAFARTVAPRLRHVHLKDYRASWTDDGYRLMRCPIGDGAVPFKELLAAVDRPEDLTACIEPGALAVRHIRLLNPEWWTHYPPRSAESLAAGLKAARLRRLAPGEDWRTPWEKDALPEEIIAYEMSELNKSVENLRLLGLL